MRPKLQETFGNLRSLPYKQILSVTDHAYYPGHAGNSGRIVQELCESRGGRPGLSVLTSLLVSVDVKNY